MSKKEYQIGEEKVVLEPLDVEVGLDLAFELSDDETRNAGLRALVVKTLEKSGRKAKEFPLTVFKALVEAVVDVNGLSDKKKD